ncbi:cellulose biosynthesis cyclic di-GMP-binding regulatory protein BcsB [Pseudomonas sp. 5P_3.1_Bac2]|uniref:cellulose biosynthesis cyclic di-GMP-binding regulatory protein BcsB n=1 Tax=Pseudomonas sp. 5P_3.1_Bac2 TaxID=2971617 RepID=UPI0021C959EC|nr:cellulose biosynthesis cyclic di-GMP-binding regulatory protein BcsB [Pseudomonas sp. 5P_3.1_Bac2]MCU1717242.1 cellulose biosynthesis cyclic di-GMP-binding regulatory protein BcsB [Pseudomonas sp. 5P_3.1_Bac2]
MSRTSPGLLAMALPLLLSMPASAAEDVTEVSAEPAQPVSIVEPSFSATLKQLGTDYTMQLRGVEGSDSVSFDVRADQVVTQAKVNLEYSYSPALLPDLSQINVLVNDQLAASLALPKETAGTLLKQQVELPPQLITEYNRLSFQLIGHYTMECEDPLHSSLWAKVGNSTELQLFTEYVGLGNELARLPLPFFDQRDSRLLQLPFVFVGSPDSQTLEAAGTVSSWLGALASYRGAKFPVSLGELPQKGNAIVLLNGSAALAGFTDVPKDVPSLTIADNPNDPQGKILLIAGKDAAQLKLAAQALVSGSQVLSGAQARIDKVASLAPRKPYDAPNWLPSDRPVQLGELTRLRDLNVSGFSSGIISVPLRLPPDLFSWREKGVPLHLRYRYTPQPVANDSSLLVSVSGKFIKSEPLPSREQLKDQQSLLAKIRQDDTLLRELDLYMPLESIPLQANLQLRFMYDYIKEGQCRDVIVDNMRGTVEPDSTIDLSGYQHFIAMPNLGVFHNSGFPFTRLADLSQTSVVLPANAAAAELSLYLELLGRFGQSTGLPASAVTVTDGEDPALLSDKDLLVLALGSQPELLQRWAQYLPASVDGSARFELSDLVHHVRNWLTTDSQINARQAHSNVSLTSGGAGAYLAGFESPLSSGRSVVVVAANSAEKLGEISAALRGGEDYEQNIQGSLAVINGKRISSLVAEEQYFVGDLGWFRYLQWLLARNLTGMLLLTALGVGLITLVLFLSLRARARQRLNG